MKVQPWESTRRGGSRAAVARRPLMGLQWLNLTVITIDLLLWAGILLTATSIFKIVRSL